MERLISLNGAWQFKDFYGEDWRWRDSHKPDTRDTRLWRIGSVPGSVQHDLLTLGEIPNPYLERNSLLAEWVPARTWLYKRTFEVDENLRGQRLQLRFEGIDYEAEIFLNGDSLGHHTGMATPATFEVTDWIRFGEENLIAVVIEPAPHEQPQVGRTSKVTTHKGRMTYWWDFCPRMVHVGIWDDVLLVVTGAARIDNAFIRPQLSDDFSRADVMVSVDIDSEAAQAVEVEITLRQRDLIVASAVIEHSLSAGLNRVELTLPVQHPSLWWPNGIPIGHTLYEAEICVRASGAHTLDMPQDCRTFTFGIRKIELLPNEGAEPGARPYTFIVNGKKIYAKGWNWVPIDVMYGVPRPEKLAHLMTLLQYAHVNLLRVWGGGLIEKEAFYEECDKRGIMVWQEFLQSSSGIDNNPPQSPDMIDSMVREAEQIIPSKRNHPSLVLWCGGNELQTDDGVPLDDSHPMLGALKEVVNRLDPDRLWLPTSPTGRVFMNSLENIERDPNALHDVHGPWEYQGVRKHYELYNAGTALLHSEFGVEGITNLKTLNATIAPEHQQPATLDNPIWQHLGAWWVKQPMWQATFGEITDIETLVKATQMMQAEGLRYAVEANRRRKWHTSGSLPWQFNEPFPMAACTSAVDYYGRPKPAYYAVAHAYEPVHVSASFPMIAWEGETEFTAEVWLDNSAQDLFDAMLFTRIVGLSGREFFSEKQRVALKINHQEKLTTIQLPLTELDEEVFFLDLMFVIRPHYRFCRRYIFTKASNLAPLLSVGRTELDVTIIERRDNQWLLTITNIGSVTALYVWLEDGRDLNAQGYVYFRENYFCLFPGHKQTLWVDWSGVPTADRRITLSGWNVESRTIT